MTDAGVIDVKNHQQKLSAERETETVLLTTAQRQGHILFVVRVNFSDAHFLNIIKMIKIVNF